MYATLIAASSFVEPNPYFSPRESSPPTDSVATSERARTRAIFVGAVFSVPPLVLVWIGWLCIDRDPIWLLNAVGPFIVCFGHVVLLVALWAVAVILTPENATGRNTWKSVVGITLGCIYIPSAFVSWIMIFIGAMSF